MGADGAQHRLHMLGPEHQVERQTGSGHRRQTLLDGRLPQPPVRVRLGQRLVPDPDDEPAVRSCAQRSHPVGDVGRGEVDPADHADDVGVAGRHGEQVRRLGSVVQHLDENGRVDARLAGGGRPVRHREGPADRLPALVDPRLVSVVEVPHVDVRVEAQAQDSSAGFLRIMPLRWQRWTISSRWL